ncbi:hypothetical protein PtB15_3B240 [Puccinia triticina]|nr:hypothetical protein PtB15_3B240 [Puccinia triticina]
MDPLTPTGTAALPDTKNGVKNLENCRDPCLEFDTATIADKTGDSELNHTILAPPESSRLENFHILAFYDGGEPMHLQKKKIWLESVGVHTSDHVKRCDGPTRLSTPSSPPLTHRRPKLLEEELGLSAADAADAAASN